MVPAETLVGLQNLLVHLRDVSAENAHVYQYRLWDAKRVKVETAQNRGVSPDGAAGYRDGLRRTTNGHPLSAEEVQKVVSRVPAETLVGLQNLLVHLWDVSAENAHVYQYRLWDAKRVKVETAQNRGVSPDGAAGYRDGLRWTTNGHPLSAEEVQKVVSRVPAETLVGLQNLLVHLRDVSAENAHVYQYRLWDAKRVKVETAQNRGVSPDGAAGYRDGLRRATNGHPLSAEEVPAETLVGLQNLLVHLRDVSAENAHVYQYRLWDAKRVKVETAQNRGVSPDGAAGYRDGLRRTTNGHPLSAEEVQKVVSRVPAETLVGLQNLLVHLWDVSAENAHVYQYRLWDAKRVKVETAQNRGVSPDGAAGYRDGLRRATNGHPLSAEEVQKVVSRVPAETLVGLQNLLVHLWDVSAENAHVYQYRLWDAKRVKVETAQNRGVSPDGAAGYRDGLRRDHQRPPALRRGGTEGRQPGEPALQLAAQRVVAVNACRTAPEGSAGRLLSLLDQLRLPDAGALPDWGLHPAETLVGLQNLLVHLRDVSAENAHVYQYRLWDAKRVKVETAQNRGVSPDGAAGYRDGLRRATNGHPLSAEEVQKVVSRVNQLSS
ncbi:hypothetical protein FJT64_010206 [Amphibalanus amphitrite]|uniref:Uncharacterized protein n=1 Tax=Amphibalanus amphitrite TaxID=1232801 RepID=A0A6A4VCY1_AMPAM|nr:hypothetical protein FJT64_010206 [Amphibalanus amphitrite]